MSIQAITVISVVVFVLAIKYFKISVVLESDFTKKLVNYYNTSYSFKEIKFGAKSIAKSTYTFIKPIVPQQVENKIKELILKHNINELSRKKVNELEPLFFDEVVSELLDQTKEAYKLVNLGTFPSLGQLNDVTSYLDNSF